MRSSLLLAAALFLAFFLACGRIAEAAGPSEADQFAATARRAGLRVLAGEHVVLATDRPARQEDGVEDLPRIFDAAFARWCAHYQIDPVEHRQWRALACLMTDREAFRAAGLLPAAAEMPAFEHGYCARDRFWMMDQSNPAYRRHLFLHEGVHAFTITLRQCAAPVWYTEGIAEYLATHRLARDADGTATFVSTPLPLASGDVEQLGRIEKIRSLRAAHAGSALADVFATPPTVHHALDAYASSWAAVAMLSGHPAHAEAFAAAERGPLDADFTRRLTESQGWNASRAAHDFDAFTDDLDYGYDFARSAIDWSAGRPLESRQTVTVAADRGWQNSGWTLSTGQRATLRAAGRVQVGRAEAGLLESEAVGISLDWYRGRPIGRLLAAQWVEKPADGGRPRFVVLGEGAAGELTALTDGPLYFKVNESPGALADNAGSFRVEIE
jgi:hypothetical protein